MVEPMAGLISPPQVARVRTVDRKPTSRDQELQKREQNKKEKYVKKGDKALTQIKPSGHKGTICDMLL